MHRPCIGFLGLLVLFIVTTFAYADGPGDWVALTSDSSVHKPAATIIKSDDNETLIKFTTTGFWSRDVEVDGTIYQLLKIPGYASTLEVGRAQMPVISELVAIPGHAAVRVEILETRELTLDGFRVFPFQEPRLERAPDPGFSKDSAFYGRDAIFPADQAVVGSPGIWRDLRVVNLRVHPLRHNPLTGELKACSEIIVRLSYEELSDVNVKEPLRHPIAENFDRMYSQGVLNYQSLNLPAARPGVAVDKFDEAYDYLIIAEDDYIANMSGFATYKETLGLDTNIIPISQVGSTYTLIKDFIADEYINNGIRYVLLVGDEKGIPAYEGYGFFSDYYYTTLEGDDDYADIAIGRFCVSDADQVLNMVTKSVAFESNPPLGGWLEKSLLIANYELAPDKYQLCKEEVRTATDTASQTYSVLYPEFTTAYGAATALGGDEATNADVSGYFSEGFRLVNYRGHGERDTWWSWNIFHEDFTIEDVLALDNGQYTPVVFSIACENNAIGFGRLTIGEVFTQGDAAAVAFLGASSPSYTIQNHDYDKQLYAAIFDDGINAIGDASNEASVRVINLWGSYGITNARMYLWLGDPSLQLIFSGATGPTAPLLASPAPGSSFDSPAQVLLDWDEVATAVSYHVMVAGDSDFSSLIGEQEGLALTEWTTPELGDGEYFWRVRANDGELYGVWSSVWDFNVGGPPAAPVLISPLDGVLIRGPADLLLKWYEVTGAASYYLEVDNSPSFSSPDRTATVVSTGGPLCSFEVLPVLELGPYFWRVKALDPPGSWSETWGFRLSSAGGKKELSEPYSKVSLDGNYPNPFNPMTSVYFHVPRSMPVQLRVYDVSGRLVRTLLDGQVVSAGENEVVWDGKDSSGRVAAAGVYFCRLSAGSMVLNKRMTLLK